MPDAATLATATLAPASWTSATWTSATLLAAAGLLLLAACAYVGISAAVALRFSLARRCRPAPCAGGEPVSFAARDGAARIDGWYLPAATAAAAASVTAHDIASTPAIVFVHGKDACRGDELKSPTFALAQALAAAGSAVLMIDLRGHGTSSRALLTYGQRERFDVLGAVDWLQARGHARIGVLGASMGAATALLAAAEEPAIRAVVADSAFADFQTMMQRQYRKLSGLPPCFLPGALLLSRLFTGVDVRQVRPLEQARRLQRRPVLVIHSEGDRFVPPADAHALAGVMGAECWTTDSPGHIGSYRAQPLAYTERVLGFFGRHLQPAPETVAAVYGLGEPALAG